MSVKQGFISQLSASKVNQLRRNSAKLKMVRKKDFLRKQSIDNYNENNDEFSVYVNLTIFFSILNSWESKNLQVISTWRFLLSHLSTGDGAP